MHLFPTCVIAGNIITVNRQKVFEQPPDLDFSSFSKAAFRNLKLEYPKFYRMDRLCKLGFLAVEYLLAGNPSFRHDESTAIVLSNSCGSSDSDLAHIRNSGQPSPTVFVYTLPNIVAGEIAIRHGIKGETAFFICEREDEPVMQQYAEVLLANGMAGSAIIGWVDYADERYFAKFSFLPG